VKISLARHNAPVASVAEALDRILGVYQQAVAAGADLVAFPEMAVIGLPAPGFLQESDLRGLASRIGLVPLMVGAKQAAALPLPDGEGVFCLSQGGYQSLASVKNSVVQMLPSLLNVAPQIHDNNWNRPHRYIDGYHLAKLVEYGVQVIINFFRQPCPKNGPSHASHSIPFSCHWHRLDSGSDPVAGSGLVSSPNFFAESSRASAADSWAIMDVLQLCPQLLQSEDPEDRSTLVVGCAAWIPMMIGRAELRVEILRTWLQFSTGMMFRHELPETEGMLFTSASPMQSGFYMKNTRVPLSIAYIDADGVIREIHDLHPFVVQSVRSKSNEIRFILEVAQGWFDRHGIRVGGRIGPLSHCE